MPDPIIELIDELDADPSVTAVVIGGSRALGRERADSDWDVGVYYRGELDLTALEVRGTVHRPGAWGRIMNGGSWLTIGDANVDVLLRDLDAVDHWAAEATHGRFDIDGLPGYVAGIPTYSLVAEASIGHPIRGAIDVPTDFPPALCERGPARWRFNRDFSLHHAEMHARRANAVGALGQVARAILEEAHARCCAAQRWTLNEKHLIGAADLDDIHGRLVLDSPAASDLLRLVDEIRTRLVEDR